MRSRTFVIICGALLVIAVIGGGYCVERRLSGGQALAEVRAQAACPSASAALDQLIASAPRLDPDRQARFLAWTRAESDALSDNVHQVHDERWFLAGEDGPPPKVQAWMQRCAPRMEELRALLREGPLCTTSLGAVESHRDHLLTASPNERRIPVPNLLVLRGIYRWFGLDAMTAADPTEALDALDALHRSQVHPAGLIDSMVGVACGAMRDRTYLQLVLRDRVPPTHLRAWLAESASTRDEMVRALRGERLLNWSYLADLVESGTYPRAGYTTLEDLDWWLNAERKIARMGRQHLVAEAVLAGDQPVSALDEFDGDEDQLMFGINVPAMMITIVSSDTAHRLARSAASMVLAQRRSGALPQSNDEALAAVLPFRAMSPGDTYAPVLRYERVEDGHFRILADTQEGLAPEVRKDVALYLANPHRRLDAERTAGPQVAISMWSIELRVR